MNEYYITFARNHREHYEETQGITEIDKGVLKVRSKDIDIANKLAAIAFDNIYSTIYIFWSPEDSKNYAPHGVTHELKWEQFVNDEFVFDIVELDKPEKI
jgi:hypothetical protein